MEDIACDSLCYSLCIFLHIIILVCCSVGNSSKLQDTTSWAVRLRPQDIHGIYKQCCN